MNGPPGMAMNAAAGGPVGGPPGIGQHQAPMLNDQQGADLRNKLNTYIYDHFLKNKQYELARSFYNSPGTKIHTRSGQDKGKPNGISSNEPKDDPSRPSDLPAPELPLNASDSSFLFDWFCMFWDTFSAARQRATYRAQSLDYVAQQRMKPGIFNPEKMMNIRMMGMNNQMMKNRTPQQMQQELQNRKMMGPNMQRDPSNMDMSQRPHTPGGSMNDAPSPKRAKLDDGSAFSGQGMQAGNRPMGNPQLGNPMMSNGLSDGQVNAFAAGPNGQPKMEGMNGMTQGQIGQSMEMEYINNRMPATQQNGPGEGRHALQDYQMQLMLLEQQNKKRLLQARREQENINSMTTGPGGAGGNNPMFAPSMSPSGSRGGGPSPNPSEQTLRRVGGTPKMPQQGLPGSPMPDMQRNSPGAPNMDPANGQIPQGMPQQYYSQMNAIGRPPSSHPNFPQGAGMSPQQVESMRMARMQNGSPWPPGAPGLPNASGQPGPAAMGTPGQRAGNNMPPPPAPPSEPSARAQESSPAQAPAPPTPQTTKAAPKKKETAASKKKNAPKKGGAAAAAAAAAAATPASEAEPPTPTPSTPITPMHSNPFTKAGAQQGAPANAPPPQASQAQGSQPSIDPNAGGTSLFGPTGGMDDGTGFSLDFADINSSDVLDNFDFDSFLQTGDDNGLTFDGMNFTGDPVEAGAGNV